MICSFGALDIFLCYKELLTPTISYIFLSLLAKIFYLADSVNSLFTRPNFL